MIKLSVIIKKFFEWLNRTIENSFVISAPRKKLTNEEAEELFRYIDEIFDEENEKNEKNEKNKKKEKSSKKKFLK